MGAKVGLICLAWLGFGWDCWDWLGDSFALVGWRVAWVVASLEFVPWMRWIGLLFWVGS